MKQLTVSVLISSVLASGSSFADLEPPSGPTMNSGEEYSWVHQFGSDKVDSANAIATFGASIYVVGGVDIGYHSSNNVEDSNGYIRRYDLWGNLILKLPFGEPHKAEAKAVFADETGIYAVGETIKPPARMGVEDILIIKYDHVGNVMWSHQFDLLGPDDASGITADSTGIYVVGSLGGGHSGFINKYDRDGNNIWNQEIGNNGDHLDWASAVTVDHTGVYVTGALSDTSLNPYENDTMDAFIRKYDTNGNELWNRQFGTSVADRAYGISATNNAVYVVGHTGGALPNQQNTGSLDAFIRKYDTYGSEIWTRQFGSDRSDDATSVIAKGNSIYMAGSTEGALPGKTALGDSDAFMRAYDSNGNELTTLQFGTDKSDSIGGIAKNWSGLYVAGSVSGTLPGLTSLAKPDAFVANLKLPNCWRSLENWQNYCENTW